MLSEPPLVGRDEELGYLNEALRQMTSGSGRLILISGEAGIGKTRLATEFERKAEASGCKVLFGSCLPSARIPYMVFLDALNDLFVKESEQKVTRVSKFVRSARRAAPELMSAVPLIGNTLQASTVLLQKYKGEAEEPGKEHVLFRTLELLRKESAKKPIVMHLDDLQWADSMSIGMLHFLARNCREMRILLLGTYRSEEVLNKEGGIHPFLESIRVMKREDLVQELQLRPLLEKELDQIVIGMLDRPVHESVLNRIFHESGGSPLFAVETVRLLESIGALVLKDRKWTIEGSMDGVIPSSVREVITRRIERTSKDERKALDYASVIGMTFSPPLLADALKKDQLEVLEDLEHLSDQHQLITEISSGYMFNHEKVRKFTYDGISKMRRKEVHRTVGQLIEKQLPNKTLYPDLATHFFFAEDHPKMIKYSAMAGEFCMEREAVAEAIPFFQRVIDLSLESEKSEQSYLMSIEGMGDAYVGRGAYQEASDLFEKAIATSMRGDQKARALRKLADCWSPFSLGAGNSDKAKRYAEEALSIPEIEQRDIGGICNLLQVIAASNSDWEEAIRQGQLSYEALRKANHPRAVAEQLIVNVEVYLTLGKVDQALELLKEASNISDSIKNPYVQCEVDDHYGLIYCYMGLEEKASHHFDSLIETCKKFGYDSSLSIAYFYKSILAQMTEDGPTSISMAERSLEYAKKVGSRYLSLQACSWLAHVSYLQKDLSIFQRYSAEAIEISNKFDSKMKNVAMGLTLMIKAEDLINGKNFDNGNSLYRDAIQMFSNCSLGKLMEALSSAWYGDELTSQKNFVEAGLQFHQASTHFAGLGNSMLVERCETKSRNCV